MHKTLNCEELASILELRTWSHSSRLPGIACNPPFPDLRESGFEERVRQNHVMDAVELAVASMSVVGIALVAWYFLLSEGGAAKASLDSSGRQLVRITIKGAYDPSLVEVRSGQDIELEFYRDETDSCSDTVVFSDLGVSKALPPFRSTKIKIGPLKAGRYPFHCSMDMIRGTLVVRDE